MMKSGNHEKSKTRNDLKLMSINKIYEGLDTNFIPIKNMKRKCGKTNKLFYFQVRESPTHLNIPIPTAASDRGGPVDVP